MCDHFEGSLCTELYYFSIVQAVASKTPEWFTKVNKIHMKCSYMWDILSYDTERNLSQLRADKSSAGRYYMPLISYACQMALGSILNDTRTIIW